MPCPQDGWVPPAGRTAEITLEETPAVPGLIIAGGIGAGGSSTVWKARRRADGAAVALKVGRGNSSLTSARFRRDAEALERVGPPFVPRLYEYGHLPDGRPYIVMELLLGRTLATRLEGMLTPPDPALVAEIGGAILVALEAAHAKDVIHRDLKPENIVLAEDTRRATLIDFGLTRSARDAPAGITRPGTVVGTPEYMAPEQVRGDPAQDTRTDIYAFGVILYELMTLRLPFVGDRAAIEHGHLALRPPRPREFAAVPIALEKLALSCLAKEPERRPPDVSALRLALAWASPRPSSSSQETAPEAAPVAAPEAEAAPTPASGAASSSPAPPPVSGLVSISASATARVTVSENVALSTSRGAQLLVDGRQPAVVMVVEAGSRAASVASAVTAYKGFVARQKANRLVCVFSGMHTDDPARSAIMAARDIAEGVEAHMIPRAAAGDSARIEGAAPRPGSPSPPAPRAALHLAALTIRRKEHGPPAVYGAAVEQPASWMPRGSWSGIVLTEELARALPDTDVGRIVPDASLEGEGGAAFHRLRTVFPRVTSSGRAVPLFGRDSVIAALAASIEASLTGGSPGLFTLIGDHGLGKTRLVSEAATLVQCMRQRALVISVRSAQPVAGDTGQTTRELLMKMLEVSPGERPADPRRLCVDKLGPEIGEEVWRAVAASLGWMTIEQAKQTPTWSTRRGVMRALAEGLRARARRGPVAVIIDDAHWTDELALDAIELATLDAADTPLWILVAAHPRFADMRRSFGARAQESARVVLPPLDEQAGMRLAAELLLPAEYTPDATLRQLASWAGYNPFCLSELVRALKRAGFVRKRPSGSFYVATAELDRLPPLPAWQWLAGRRLETLPPELAACVRLCAVLGLEFSRDEVERVQDAIEQSGGAGTPIDAGVGLAALVDCGILSPSESGWYAFQSAPFRDAVYESLAAEQRQMIHRHAYVYWSSEVQTPLAGPSSRSPLSGPPSLSRLSGPASLSPGARSLRILTHLARHAGACGERDAAIRAYIELGDRARESFQQVEADQDYTAALSFLEGTSASARGADSGASAGGADSGASAGGADSGASAGGADSGATSAERARLRAAALLGRAKVRYRVHRIREALDDLRAASVIARDLGDGRLLTDVLLEESTVLDWAGDFALSAARAEEARSMVTTLGDPVLENRSRMAEGRSFWRQQRVADAIELLARASAGAEQVSDRDTRVMALLLLASALVIAGRLAEAEARFHEVISLCTEAKDRLHLCSAYANRAYLWTAQSSPERGMEDLRRAVQIAREVGNPEPEHVATHNLAELLHWSGQEEAALALARRSRVLGDRFGERESPGDALLVARIQAARGDFKEASQIVAWIEEHCPPSPSVPTMHVLFQMLKLALKGAPLGEGAWGDLMAQAEADLPAEELLEVLYWAVRSAIRAARYGEADRLLDKARSRLPECAMWRPRFDELAAHVSAALVSPPAGPGRK